MYIRHGILLLLSTAIISSCSVLKKEGRERDARDFLVSFQNSLRKNDDAILEQFGSSLSKDMLLSTVRVLQNKEHQHIICEPSYGKAAILFGDKYVRIELPVTFRSRNVENAFQENTLITFYLNAGMETYTIIRMEVYDFYYTLAKLRRELEWEMEREKDFSEDEILNRSV